MEDRGYIPDRDREDIFSPPIPWVPAALSLKVKRPWHEADHSPPSNADVKKAWSYTFTIPCVFMAWGLIKQEIRFHGVTLR
jgi:hypothetical protein